jgi:hypothetical protein
MEIMEMQLTAPQPAAAAAAVTKPVECTAETTCPDFWQGV